MSGECKEKDLTIFHSEIYTATKHILAEKGAETSNSLIHSTFGEKFPFFFILWMQLAEIISA